MQKSKSNSEFTIAIVGRPNVGKSSLFNRLVGRKAAIVNGVPGVTRDWKEANGSLGPLEFKIIDTAGLEIKPKTDLEKKMQEKTEQAFTKADQVLFLLDGRAGVTEKDREFARLIRKKGKVAILVINKCESKISPDVEADALKLGFGEAVYISAEHNLGFGDLYDKLEPIITKSEKNDAPKEREKYLSISIVGRPNAGKSTLFNTLLGRERTIVSDIPGTTRDAIEEKIKYKGHDILLVDTAGLRKKSNIEEELEQSSVYDTLHAIKYANIVILMVDGLLGIERQDFTIADHVIREGRCLIIAMNKWDKIENHNEIFEETKYRIEKSLTQAKGVPIIFISAEHEKNIDKLLDACLNVYEKWNTEIGTGQLNRWLEKALEIHAPPIVKGSRFKLRYITQVKIRPPSYVIFANKSDLPESYVKYLCNSLREYFDMQGVPIRISLKKSKNPYTENKSG